MVMMMMMMMMMMVIDDDDDDNGDDDGDDDDDDDNGGVAVDDSDDYDDDDDDNDTVKTAFVVFQNKMSVVLVLPSVSMFASTQETNTTAHVTKATGLTARTIAKVYKYIYIVLTMKWE